MSIYEELFLLFTAGAFWGYASNNIARAIYQWHRSRKKKPESPKSSDFKEHLSKLMQDGEKLIKSRQKELKSPRPPEVHKFQWRHDGKTNEVEIIIDPSLDTTISGTRDEFEAMLKKGDIESLEGLLAGLSTRKDEKLINLNKFIFSKKSVEQMRIAGLSPDELVVKMLRAAGRMD
jgi:hypothetical protein